MFLYDDLEIYKNTSCRSSYYVLKLWEDYIEKEFIANLGMRKSMMISIYLDYDMLFYTITSDYKAILTKNIPVKIPHTISALQELSTTINMTITNSDSYDLQFSQCAFCFDKLDHKDEGSIEIDLYSFCSIQKYLSFKVDFLTRLCKEMQFAIQRNYLQKNVDIDPCCHYDTEFEVINMYKILLNKTFKESLKELVDKKRILDLDVDVLTTINDLITEN